MPGLPVIEKGFGPESALSLEPLESAPVFLHWRSAFAEDLSSGLLIVPVKQFFRKLFIPVQECQGETRSA